MKRLYSRSCYRQKSCINDMGGIVHTSILDISPSPRRLNGMKSLRLYFKFLPPLRSLTAQTQKAITISNTGIFEILLTLIIGAELVIPIAQHSRMKSPRWGVSSAL